MRSSEMALLWGARPLHYPIRGCHVLARFSPLPVGDRRVRRVCDYGLIAVGAPTRGASGYEQERSDKSRCSPSESAANRSKRDRGWH